MQRFDFITNDLRCKSAAAGTVNAEHHSFHGIVISRPSQQPGCGIATNESGRLVPGKNLAGCDDNSDVFLIALVARQQACLRQKLIQPDSPVAVWIFGVRTCVLGDSCIDCRSRHQAVDQTGTECDCCDVAVLTPGVFQQIDREIVEDANVESASRGNFLLVMVPKLIEKAAGSATILFYYRLS